MRTTQIYFLLVLALFGVSHSIKFNAVNDPSNYLKTYEDNIRRNIKSIENSRRLELTLFVDRDLRSFWTTYNLDNSYNLNDITQFTGRLYQQMYGSSYKGNDAILVFFSIEERKTGFYVGSNAKRYISISTLASLVGDISYYMKNRLYGKGIDVYIGKVLSYINYEPGNFNWTPIIIFLSIVGLCCCCCCCIGCLAGNSEGGRVSDYKNLSSNQNANYTTNANYNAPSYNETHYNEFNDKMERFRYINQNYRGNNIMYDYCMMCFNDFSVMEQINVLPCGHRFHYGCIQMAISRGDSCPTCRNNWQSMDRDRFYQNVGAYHMGFYPGLSTNFSIHWDNHDYRIDRHHYEDHYDRNNYGGQDRYGNRDRGVDDYNANYNPGGNNANYNPGGNNANFNPNVNYGGQDSYGNRDRGVDDNNANYNPGGNNANFVPNVNYGGQDSYGNDDRGTDDNNANFTPTTNYDQHDRYGNDDRGTTDYGNDEGGEGGEAGW